MAQVVTSTSARTLDDVVNAVKAELQGWVRDQERTTYLTADITNTATSVNVPAGQKGAAGTIEIGYELIWVSDVDSTNGVLTVPPYGRGTAGTLPAAHAAGDKITYTPRFPKTAVANAINATIKAIGTELPATGTTSFTNSAAVMTYALPATVEKIQLVSYQSLGPSQRWVPVDWFDFDPAANTTAFPTGKTISLQEGVPPGRTVQVVYTQLPTELTNDTDLFSTSGLPASCVDVVQFGACARLAVGMQSSVADYQSVAADVLDNQGSAGQEAGNLSRYYYLLYQSRLQDEVRKFWQVHQPRVRKTL